MTNDLSLTEATTQQILDELFNRKTFAGVLVYSPTSHKFNTQAHDNFELRTTCDDQSTLYILDSAIAALKTSEEEA
jgi:hypothetical protein